MLTSQTNKEDTMDAATEITNFAADQWALIFQDDAVSDETERGECVRLLAQYGPAINHNTKRD